MDKKSFCTVNNLRTNYIYQKRKKNRKSDRESNKKKEKQKKKGKKKY